MSSSSTPQPIPSFEDPALKAAVHRVWGRERAPAEVSRRIAGIVSNKSIKLASPEESAADPSPAIRPVEPVAWQTNWPGLAAAAAIMLALGTVVYVLSRGDSGPQQRLAAAPLPATVVNALVATHDACAGLHDHHHMKEAPRGDYAAIAGQLASRLGHPVLAAPIGGDAWTFRGAAVCPVGSTPAAHLVFAHERPDEHISIFSMPQSAATGTLVRPTMSWRCGAVGPCYESTVAGHPVVGFTGNGAFYCLVGSSERGSLTVDELRSICDRLRRDMTRVAAPNRVAVMAASEPALQISSLHDAARE